MREGISAGSCLPNTLRGKDVETKTVLGKPCAFAIPILRLPVLCRAAYGDAVEDAKHIRLLTSDVINKIAAGEVVERPASVLKELVENAVDAGATQIDVEISTGGRKLVAVRDDGVGMSRDDALLSIERHATSKIRDVDDIERINTMGFRGEALAAIAAVSRYRLVTCRRGEVTGTELTVTGGKIQDARDFGCPVGTAVEVRDLFFNVPARRKFLRSHQTESAHVREAFIVQALGHPAIGMSLKVDGQETHRLPASPNVAERIRDLFGADYGRQLRPVDHASRGVKAAGFVSLPAASRADRNEQFVFVNGRPTSAALVSFAIREGYRTLLPADRHACVFLFIQVDPEAVDVNVHPTKREVRFRHTGDVRDTVIEAIRGALGTEAVRPAGAAPALPDLALPMRPAAQAQMKIDDLPPTRAFRYPRLPVVPGSDTANLPAQNVRPDSVSPPLAPRPSPLDTPPSTLDTPTPPLAPSSAPWSWCRVVGQIGGLYVVLETEDGYVLMDPHAAHERVLFEKFMADVLNRRVHSQNLLMPETVALTPKDALRVRKNLPLLKEMGFGVSEFGGDTFVVDALPPYFSGLSAQSLLIEVSHTLEQAGARGGQGRWREEAIVQAACKTAVKARDTLKLEEIEKLVIDLAQTEMPYTCPHGRPTLIFTSFAELNRKFGRE
jgi:DNA mismatch repair protein MutL